MLQCSSKEDNPYAKGGQSTPRISTVIPFRIPIAFLLLCLFALEAGCGSDPAGVQPNPVPGLPESFLDREPTWSPSGSQIAYVHYAQTPQESQLGDRQIWIYDMRADTSRYLTPGFDPRWSPIGDTLAFVREDGLYRMATNGNDERKLTAFGDCFSPTWSPNADRVAFDTGHNDPRGSHAIWIVNADGSNLRDISVHGTGEWRAPDWSPGGTNILHYRWIGIGTPELFLMSPSGTNPMRLTSNDRIDYDPSWNPTGNSIAWTSFAPGSTTYELWVMNSDGTNQHRIHIGARDPSWAPDGKHIACSIFDSVANQFVLGSLNSDGDSIHILTSPAAMHKAKRSK